MTNRYGTLHTLRCLLAGQSLLRIRMNAAFAGKALRGKVVDVGGGHHPDYFAYFSEEEGASIEAVDGSTDGIDFETDALPYADASADTVILANVLEHVFDYAHLLGECRRILAPGGQLIGFVPFWQGYHPDPRDYFRYTGEALARILAEAGFADARIEPVLAGPLLANFNTVVLSLPRALRPIAYLWYAAWNALFVSLRPASVARQPLGYVFAATV